MWGWVYLGEDSESKRMTIKLTSTGAFFFLLVQGKQLLCFGNFGTRQTFTIFTGICRSNEPLVPYSLIFDARINVPKRLLSSNPVPLQHRHSRPPPQKKNFFYSSGIYLFFCFLLTFHAFP